jgi:hypothetical protein
LSLATSINSGFLPCTRLASAAAISTAGMLCSLFEPLDELAKRLAFAGGERGADAIVEACDALIVHDPGCSATPSARWSARRALDHTQHVALARRDEQYRLAAAPGAPVRTDAMHVGFGS